MTYDAKTGQWSAVAALSEGGQYYFFTVAVENDNVFGKVVEHTLCLGTDTDEDDIPDACDNCPNHANADQEDCDGDSIGDVCAVADGLVEDCNDNGVPDQCDLEGTSPDCNGNANPDECDIADGTSEDCNDNGEPDECELDPVVDQADFCVDAEPVCPGLSYPGTLEGSTVDGASSCSVATEPDVWYRYVPDADGTLVVGVCTPPISSRVTIHTGCPGDLTNELACSVFGGAPECLGLDEYTHSWEATINVTAGTEYVFRVASSCSGCGTFPFVLNLSGPDCLISSLDDIDCNENGVPDACDPDCNGNNTPDDCEQDEPTTHLVDQVGHTFVPANIVVEPGDIVEWRWADSSHTVTSGSPCTPDGRFDEPLTDSNSLVSFTVPLDEPNGDIPYFCIPHCEVGMTGTITVQGVEPEACCLAHGKCEHLPPDECVQLCGAAQGAGSDCADAECPAPVACCLLNGSCRNRTVAWCIANNGTSHGAGSVCHSVECPQRQACCLGNGSCHNRMPAWCEEHEGQAQGAGTTCATAECLQTEACCKNNGTCWDVTETYCIEPHGEPQGPGTACLVDRICSSDGDG